MMAVPIFVAGYISSRRSRLVLVVGDDWLFPFSSQEITFSIVCVFRSFRLFVGDDGCFRFPPKNQEDIVLLPVSGVGVGVGVLVPWLGRGS